MKKKYKMFTRLSYIFIGFTIVLFSCKKDPNSTGLEYAPEMYHSLAYEPLSQITDKNHPDYNSNPYNPFGMNMRKPVLGTVKISKYTPKFGEVEPKKVLAYSIHKDSFELSGRTLKNPLDSTEAVLAEGKILYERFCLHCHGETGQGDGPVGKVYKGVPSYSKGRVKQDTPGHIFHTITFGRNRMWSHASQISVEDRWKIVYYVQTLQNQD
jgi:mono/diheme cytochrome c family protein